MSEYPKVVGVVTVQANGGGVYELSSSGLVTPIKVRGEEKALAQAEILSGQIQSGLPPQLIDDDQGGEQEFELAPEDELAALMARVAELQAAGITVAVPNKHAAVDQHHKRTATVPDRLVKKLTDEEKAALAGAGIKTTRVIIDQTDAIPPSGLFVAHNGRTFMIQAGVEVDVPNFIIQVLNDAIMTQAVTDPETSRVIGHRNRLRFPYRVVPVLD
jgi:hypothetical protein